MKTLRFITIGFLLVILIFHVYYIVSDIYSPNNMTHVLSCFVFLILIVLLSMKIKLGVYIGLVFTLIPIIKGLASGMQNLTGDTLVLMIIEFLALICCIWLILKKGDFY